MDRARDKVVIVTGGASGIGAETARRLAAEGARVVLTDVDEERGKSVAVQIGEAGGRATFLPQDVSDEERWREVIAEVERGHGRLDGLVNNAGFVVMANVEETSLEDWRRIHAVHAEGTFLGCKHAIPAMRRAGGGSIVNVSSLAALRGTPIYAAYSAAKGAVRALSKTVALHCAERGDAIRCNSIHPGGVNTPLVHGVLRRAGIDVDTDPVATTRAMGMGQPEDIAHLIVFLVSDESRYVNGAEIPVDGGATAASGAVSRAAARGDRS